MLSPETRRVATVVAAFAVGVAVAGVPLTSEPLPFRESPRYPVWVLLIAMTLASCPVVWSQGMRALAKLPAHRPPALDVFTYGVCAIALFGVLVFAPAWLTPKPLGAPRVFLPYLGARFVALDLAALIAAAPGVIAMYRIRGACQRGEGQAVDLFAWRAILQAQLAALGTLIALATLATGALRNVILDAFTIHPNDVPADEVLLIGAGLTVIVALIYVPPSEQLRRRAQAMVDETFPLPRQFEGEWQQDLQRRRDLAGLLQIDGSSRSSIQNALIIGSPLITSALTLLIPTQ